MAKINIAVLCSGGGTNLQAIIDFQKAGKLEHGEIKLVVADNKDAYALERAKANGVEFAVFDRKDIPDRLERERKISALLKDRDIRLVVLAGFLSVLSDEFIAEYRDRIINVHPSLIPSFCGVGMYGLRVHKAALERGVKVTGATVHFVNEICDGGPIIAQKAVEVHDGDTPETLQRRVMEEAEWILLPAAVESVCRDMIENQK